MPAIPEDWIDISWKNDSCPSFQTHGGKIIVYADYPDPMDRDHPETTRFTAVFKPNENNHADFKYCDTDDWNEILAFVKEHSS
jgi:hypothetical protein